MKDASDQTPRLDGRWSAAVLIGGVGFAAFVSDRLIPNSLLSLPLLAATLASTLITWWGVPRLRALKMGQVIRTEGPQSHLSKTGTPTMGGLLVVPVGVIIGALVSSDGQSAQQLLAIALVTLTYMVIGGVDDWSSLTKRTNTGLTPRGKLLLQAAAAMVFLGWAGWQGWISSTVSLPFNQELPFHWLIWPLALFVFLAESNATNLTDGLDGLASGCGALVFTGLALQLMLRGDAGDPALAGFAWPWLDAGWGF